MGALSPIQYQYRSFEATYLFKVKNEEQLSVKILDIAQNYILKRVFSSQSICLFQFKILLKTGDFNRIIEKLVKENSFPKEHLLPTNKKVTREACEEMLEQTIKQFKPRILVEKKELERFTCPITLEIFREPVMDGKGHTFERSAINEHLRRSNECPIGREPIGESLVPNLIVQQAIEECQQQDPIPTFSLFQKENSKLANMHLQTAETCEEEREYSEALEAYTRAFQFTKNWEDYSALPALFEMMREYDKATLACLYLAKYQLQAGKVAEATQTLEVCQKERNTPSQINLVLIELYYYTEQSEKAIALATETAASLAIEHPDQAISLYKRILTDHPTELLLYTPLASLLKVPQEKAHILLKGALEALRAKSYSKAWLLTQEAEMIYDNSYVDGLVSLELIRRQEALSPVKQNPQVKQKLLQFARAFEEKELTSQMLSAYKMLFQLEKNPEYSQKIITAYQTLQKPQKRLAWSLTHLSLLIEHQQWEQAEALAKQLLQELPELHQQLSLYEKLEEVYTHWHGHELQDLWGKLGRAYRDNQQLDLALKTYQKAYERFHSFEEAIALAEVMHESGRTQDSVHTYYEAAVEALLEQNSDRLSLCTREIKRIDAQMQYLDINQKMHLLSQEYILQLQHRIAGMSNELQAAQQKIASLEHSEERRRIVEEQDRARVEELSKPWFGKAKWEKYFGDVGAEPPLPRNILEILASPCPYHYGKRIEATHLLVLIPETVNGKAFSLNMLGELIQHSQNGGRVTGYLPDNLVQSTLGDKSVSTSYWVLITKDVLPNSRSKTWPEQWTLVQQPYNVPNAIEIATAILMHYVETGERLYSDNPCTYTACQEYISMNFKVVVGSFGSSGLIAESHHTASRLDSRGFGAARKFYRWD